MRRWKQRGWDPAGGKAWWRGGNGTRVGAVVNVSRSGPLHPLLRRPGAGCPLIIQLLPTNKAFC